VRTSVRIRPEMGFASRRDLANSVWKFLRGADARVSTIDALCEVLGLELILDEAEGYAFLRTRKQPPEDEAAENPKQEAVPRLIARRQLSFPVSLLLALLRKKLAEFDAGGAETRLVLSRDEIVDLMRLFLPESSNEAKLVDQIERHINKVVELGFLKRLQPSTGGAQASYEVRRIIKAFVDAQWLSGLNARLDEYRHYIENKEATNE